MRILVAINGQGDDRNLLRFGAQLGRHAGEPLTLLAVTEPKADHPPQPMKGLVARMSRQLEAQQIQVQTRIRMGRAAAEILRETQARAYDLIVLDGAYPRNPASRWHPALTAVHVAEQAPCSVAIIKGQVNTVRRILLCDSGAHGPVAAPPGETPPQSLSVSERFAARLVGLFGGQKEVTVLHVMSQISAGPGVRGGQLRANAVQLIDEHTIEGELLAHDVQLLEHLGIHSRAHVRHGLVVDEILAEARSGGYDLVVIGAPADEGWRRFLLDDLAARIVEQVDRPVLVVR